MLSAALYTGLTGLTAAQRGVAVTSNNVANALTPGYTAQNLIFSDALPYGVKTQGPLDNRNLGLFKLITTTSSQVQFSEGLSGLTSIMEPSIAVGEGSVYSKLQNLQDAFARMSDQTLNVASVQALLLSSANELTQTLHSSAQTLSSQVQSISTHTQALVGDVNTLVSDIASIGKQVNNTFDLSSQSQLIDNRQAKIEALSGLIDINVTFEGNNQVSISTGNKSLLSGTLQTLLIDPSGVTGGKIGANNTAINKVIPDQLKALDQEAADTASRVNAILGQPLFSAPVGGNAGFASTISVLISDPASINTKFDQSSMNNALSDISEDVTVNYAVFGAFQNSLLSTKENSTIQLSGLSSFRQDSEGVSLEREAINLARFQIAYEANVKLISIVDDMMKTTIDMLG